MTEPVDIFQASHRALLALTRLFDQEDGMEARSPRHVLRFAPPPEPKRALTISCPKCRALPGLECWGARTYHPGGFLHRERSEAADAQARAARVLAASEARA